MSNFKQIGPSYPYDEDGRLNVRADEETGRVVISLDGISIEVNEQVARRFSIALWTASNDAQVINFNRRKRERRMAAIA